jgi:hypothetical protein
MPQEPQEAKLSTTRKVYQNPELVVYGNIETLTRSVGSNGQLDGGGGTGNMMGRTA